MNQSLRTIRSALSKQSPIQFRKLYSLSSFSEPRTGTSSFSEPSNFVYRGWHNHHPHQFHSSAAQEEDEMHLPDSRIMSPKTECQSHVTWDEDYDEDNLHISPHQATNRCEQVQHSFESLDHNDLLDLQDRSDPLSTGYSWITGGLPESVVISESELEYDDGVTNFVQEGDIAIDF
jgi:hypothetical protein